VVEELDQEKTQLTEQLSLKENVVEELDQDRINLRNELEISKNELEIIKSSKIFKLTRLFGSRIDNLSKKKQKALGVKPLVKTSVEIIKTEGIKSFVNKASDKIKRREFSVLSPELYQPVPVKSTSQKLKHENIDEPIIYEPKFSVSVTIPTNSSVLHLQPLIDSIVSQKGTSGIEIILVNSGTYSLDELKSERVKIITISPNEFNHGRSRSLGANNSSNNYVAFFTDDAIPLNDHLLYDMCKIISQDPKIAVCTGRQIPRSDCDLMYSYSLNHFYEFLGLTEDRIVRCDNFDNLDKDEKRRVCQIDDVCSCYKKEIFDKFKYNTIPYAEDLDMGIRLIKNGYKIAQLFSNGVIHSHNREASYYVKRQFIESKILSPLLGYPMINYKKIGITSLEQLMSNLFQLYNSISLSLDSLNITSSDYDDFFIKFKHNLYSPREDMPKSYDFSLNTLFEKFETSKNNSQSDFLISQYVAAIEPFENFLKKTFPDSEYIKNDIYSVFYKIFGSVIGNSVGMYVYYAKQTKLTDKLLPKVEDILGGI